MKNNYIYKDDTEPAGDDREAVVWEDRPKITHLFSSGSQDLVMGQLADIFPI